MTDLLNSQLTLTLIQTQLIWQDRKANLDHLESLISKIDDTDLIILPEMFSTGFSMASDTFAETMNGDAVKWLCDIAKTKNMSICGSLMMQSDQGNTNRFVLARPNGELVCYDKKHLFRMSKEHHHYNAGNEQVLFNIKGFQICPQICYDLRFPVWTRNTMQYDLLLFVANWPASRRQHWMTLLRARAIENQAYVVGLNRIGSDGNKVDYSGDSQVINCNGDIILDLQNRNCIETIRIDKNSLQEARQLFPAWKDADRFELHHRSD